MESGKQNCRMRLFFHQYLLRIVIEEVGRYPVLGIERGHDAHCGAAGALR